MSTVLLIVGLLVIIGAVAYYYLPDFRDAAHGWKASIMAVVGAVIAAVSQFFDWIMSVF